MRRSLGFRRTLPFGLFNLLLLGDLSHLLEKISEHYLGTSSLLMGEKADFMTTDSLTNHLFQVSANRNPEVLTHLMQPFRHSLIETHGTLVLCYGFRFFRDNISHLPFSSKPPVNLL